MSGRTPTPNAPRARIEFAQGGVEPTPEDGERLCLHCLMRDDLASMNGGKAVAQGMHAASKIAYLIRNADDASLKAMYAAWEGQSPGQGFGTTVVLSVDERQMRSAVAACDHAGLHASIVTDKSYPLRDGRVTHAIVLDTCGYVFGPRYLTEAVLHRFGLLDGGSVMRETEAAR